MCGKSNDGRGQSGHKDLFIRSQCLNDFPSYKKLVDDLRPLQAIFSNRFFSWMFLAKNKMVDVEMGYQKNL